MMVAEMFNKLKRFLLGRPVTASEDSTPSVSQEDTAGETTIEKAGGETAPLEETVDWNQLKECFQIGFMDFTTDKDCIGFFIDPDNRWVKLAHDVFSTEMEEAYADRLLKMRKTTKGAALSGKLKSLEQSSEVAAYCEQMKLPFIDQAVSNALMDDSPGEEVGKADSTAGRPAFPFRLAFGILVAQAILDLSDRGICKIVSESPYLQYFLGYTTFSHEHTIDPSNLVHFKKRFDIETMMKLNDILVRNKRHAQELKDGLSAPAPNKNREELQMPGQTDCSEAGPDPKTQNSGTLILDASCAPVNIRYPQDFSILNEARLLLDGVINRICQDHSLEKPRTYVRKIQSFFLKLAKSKKKQENDIRRVIRLELNAVCRNLGYINQFLEHNNIRLTASELVQIQTIRAVYAQQKYMFSEKTHRVQNRIVSISMPFIRPIVRGKTNCPVEFGPKYDIAVDGDGYSWITNFSFENFNESSHLADALENYRQRTGHYPERVLADQIYRTRENRNICKNQGIRLSGPAQGRKPADEEILKERAAIEQQDMVDRIEVERRFSRSKRCFGIECVVERTPENVGHAVGISVFLDNAVPVGF